MLFTSVVGAVVGCVQGLGEVVLVGVSGKEGQVELVFVAGVGPFRIKEEEMPFPFLLPIAEEGEGIDARLLEGVFETRAIEFGQWFP